MLGLRFREMRVGLVGYASAATSLVAPSLAMALLNINQIIIGR